MARVTLSADVHEPTALVGVRKRAPSGALSTLAGFSRGFSVADGPPFGAEIAGEGATGDDHDAAPIGLSRYHVDAAATARRCPSRSPEWYAVLTASRIGWGSRYQQRRQARRARATEVPHPPGQSCVVMTACHLSGQKPRSRAVQAGRCAGERAPLASTTMPVHARSACASQHARCLLYTSDAADERSSVDLG